MERQLGVIEIVDGRSGALLRQSFAVQEDEVRRDGTEFDELSSVVAARCA
jgi:hypothetical protein